MHPEKVASDNDERIQVERLCIEKSSSHWISKKIKFVDSDDRPGFGRTYSSSQVGGKTRAKSKT